ncbi:MAG: riboflavin biosynthesis protein RibF [Saprospiraceae bacterium]|nr:riboflavin biosynthesis protein RibF [Saprospiraceae bacterium]
MPSFKAMQLLYFGKDEIPDLKNPVLAIGAFDGFHRGHRQILDNLFASALELSGNSILITFEPHPRLVLDESDQDFKLLTTIDEKIEILKTTALDYLVIVPFSYSFSLMFPQEYVENFLIANFKPVKVIAGIDHRFGRDGRGDGVMLHQYASAGSFYFQEVNHLSDNGLTISSTRIRQLIKDSKIEIANQLLAYNYSFSGNVVPGNKIGRELGYRTANIELLQKNKLIPPNGIYAVFCTVNAQTYDAMLYIGHSESIAENLALSIEVHILDFNQDIYGQAITVQMIGFLRKDQKFDSKTELTRQIGIDEKATRRTLLKYKLKSQPQTDTPKIAIAILNYNGEGLLKNFLPSILNYTPKNAEIYIIDNGSTDNSVLYLEHHYPEVQIIRLRKNYGFSTGYNKGIAQIDSDYLVLLNSDVLVTMDWVSPLFTLMKQDPMIFAVQPKILALSDKLKFEYAGAAGGFIDLLRYPFCRGRIIDYLEVDNGQYNDTTEVFWSSGAAMMVKTVVFKALGGFDDDYFAHQEEIDLCWRMKRLGGKIISTDVSHVYHLGGGTLDYDNPRKTYLNFRNNLFTIFKNESWYNLIFILPSRLVLDIFIAFSYLLKGKIWVFYKIVQAYVVGIINTLYMIHKKSQTNDLIDELNIKPFRKRGILNSSIFIQFYIAGNKVFSKIPKQYFK